MHFFLVFELYNPFSNCISGQARAIETFTDAVISTKCMPG